MEKIIVNTLKKTAGKYSKNEVINDRFEISEKIYGIPEGAAIVDMASFKEGFESAIKALLFADMKAVAVKYDNDITKEEDKKDSADAGRIKWLKDNKAAYIEAMKSLDYITSKCGCKYDINTIAAPYKWLAFAATGSRSMQVADDIRDILKQLNDSKLSFTDAAIKPIRTALNDMINGLVDFRTIDSFKSIHSNLTLDNVRNICMIAKSERAKWDKNGIGFTKAADNAVLQQILLHVFGTEFKLSYSKKKTAGRSYVLVATLKK